MVRESYTAVRGGSEVSAGSAGSLEENEDQGEVKRAGASHTRHRRFHLALRTRWVSNDLPCTVESLQ